MRKYGESGILLSVVCNRCGKKLAVKEGILREGAAHFDEAWDYFSEKDGEVHHFRVVRGTEKRGTGGAPSASLQ